MCIYICIHTYMCTYIHSWCIYIYMYNLNLNKHKITIINHRIMQIWDFTVPRMLWASPASHNTCAIPGNHWSSHCLHNFAFPKILCSWHNIVYRFFLDWILFLVKFTYLFMYFRVSIAHFFLVLNNIASFVKKKKKEFIYSFYSWRTSCLLPNVGNYE